MNIRNFFSFNFRQLPYLLLLFPGSNCTTKKTLTLTQFKEGSKYGFKTITGEVVVKAKYDGVGWDFHNGFIAVQKRQSGQTKFQVQQIEKQL